MQFDDDLPIPQPVTLRLLSWVSVTIFCVLCLAITALAVVDLLHLIDW